MVRLEELKPRGKQRVYDILTKLKFDMTDWAESLTNKDRTPSSNPKYCYNWSFVRDDKQVVVLFLWYEDMKSLNERIYQEHSFKQYAEDQEKGRRKRSLEIDYAIRLAYERALSVDVVICQGGANTNGVLKRELDKEKWFVTGYDSSTGACIIERNNNVLERYVDQFKANDIAEVVHKSEKHGFEYSRSSVIRRKVLLRANGKCEYCSSDGFTTKGGDKYLETHHIVPLSEGGDDSFENVIALCPNDHRKAHFENNSSLTKESLNNIVKTKLTAIAPKAFEK
ncbi:HNH endonuclease signature motif containing protein [Pseudoalteromonas piscicida]|uniref:HNH endonuclease n=1 Tax=Pseudoalteromonas piscicida TaxID=43662 RepID=UPI00309A0B50